MKNIVKNKTEVGKKGNGVYLYPDPKNNKRMRSVIFCSQDEKTEQSSKDACDVNKIIKDYTKTGLIQHAKEYQGTYDDVPAMDFQEAMLKITSAQQMYDALPGKVRANFAGPGAFLEFVQNPDNAPQMEKMGLLRGNDGLTKTGAPSGAPTPTDKNGDGIPDPVPPPPTPEP